MNTTTDDTTAVGTDLVPVLDDDVVAVGVEDEAVLYHGRWSTLHLLDPIATAVVSRFDGEAPLGAIAAGLAEDFGAPPAVVEGDVLRMVAQLASLDLLAGIDGEGPDTAVGGQRVEEALVDGCD